MTPLITADERTHLLSNGQAHVAGQDIDPQPVMRDRYFQPVRRLSEYLRLAEDNGSITD